MFFRFDTYPFEAFARDAGLGDDLRRRLDEVFNACPGVATRRGRFDLKETEDEIVLSADLPGVRPGEVDLKIEEDTLTLTARRREEAPGDVRVHLRERRDYEVVQSFALPRRVDRERVRARLTDGVLTVHLAKAEAAKPRAITVTAG